MTNVNSANLSGKQHCSYIARTTYRGQQCRTLPKAPPKKLERPGRCSALTHSRILPRTQVPPVFPLRWVSNGSKHKHTALYHVVTSCCQTVICMNRQCKWCLAQKRTTKGPKSVICRLPRGALKCTKECNPLNAA